VAPKSFSQTADLSFDARIYSPKAEVVLPSGRRTILESCPFHQTSQNLLGREALDRNVAGAP
jgi:hypothetical protein